MSKFISFNKNIYIRKDCIESFQIDEEGLFIIIYIRNVNFKVPFDNLVQLKITHNILISELND